MLQDILPQLKHQGFDIRTVQTPGSGNKARVLITGLPFDMKYGEAENVLQNILSDIKESGGNITDAFQLQHQIAKSVARKAAIPSGKKLLPEEMKTLLEQLFACKDSANSPDGHPIFWLISRTELAARFAKP